MTVHQTIAPAPVRQEVRVKLAPAAAFDLFANRFDLWWPRDKSANPGTTLVEAVLEPQVGGRWYEKGANGTICEWGRVLVWEPARRLVLNWQLGADYRHDPELHTEVEILFQPDGEGTVVSLEHRNIERFGENWEQMRAGISGGNGWPAILGAFADTANHRRAVAPIRHSVHVKLAPEAAYDFFANHFDSWWPRDKSADGTGKRASLVFEPRAGGQWYEQRADGSVQRIGTVVAAEPGKRLVMDWQLDHYRYVPELHTTLEVTFAPDGTGTLVTLEHRDLDRFGDVAVRRRGELDAGWPDVLATYGSSAER
jgi:uncharacterized protein YndB with AHSA1/START domain